MRQIINVSIGGEEVTVAFPKSRADFAAALGAARGALPGIRRIGAGEATTVDQPETIRLMKVALPDRITDELLERSTEQERRDLIAAIAEVWFHTLMPEE